MQQHPAIQSRALFRAAAATFSLLALAIIGAAGACSPPAEPPFCLGGHITEDGKCEGKCQPEKCIDPQTNVCVGNRCFLQCKAHGDCSLDGSQECAPAVEDETEAAIMTCQPHKGPTGLGRKCPLGPECDSDPGLVCLTKGEGDGDAYCTASCMADTDCAGGYYCGVTRDPHELCGSMNPKKGDSSLCGQTADPCTAATELGEGTTLFEGPLCILRRVCMKRDECAPCATDLDCSLSADEHCVTFPKESQKRCARGCATDKDCTPDYACEGNLCIHRAGACTGNGGTCEPCLSDADCGGPTTTKACMVSSDGQRGCADLSFPIPCMTDAECPLLPSGKQSICITGSTDPAVNLHCHYWAFTQTDSSGGGKYGCW